ncbi:unnamed protein product [Arctia plantaginis]|uniref:Uncharacterized protein n=1 Tax=Arctia plantaginis TaxID=874455 RepID=A0A8S1AMV5_ARCPL|nr:unnamed protein product [Arctia plantaginis]
MLKQLGVCLILNINLNWALNNNQVYRNNYGPKGVVTYGKLSDYDKVINDWKAKHKNDQKSGLYNSGKSWYYDSSLGRYLYIKDKKKNTVSWSKITSTEIRTTKKNIDAMFIHKLATTKTTTKKPDSVNNKKTAIEKTTTEEPVTDIPSLLYWLEKAVLKIFADQLPPNNPVVTKTETENLAKFAIEKSKMERLASKQKTTKKRTTTTKTTKSKKKITTKRAALSCWVKKEATTQKTPAHKTITKRTTEILQYRQKTNTLVTILTKKLTAAKSTTKKINSGKQAVEKSANKNHLNKVPERQKIEEKKRTTVKIDKKNSSKLKVKGVDKATTKKISTTKKLNTKAERKNEPAIECLLQKSGQHRGYYDCINVK